MYKIQGEYKLSLKNYKKMLHLAWSEKGHEALKYEI